MYLATNINDDKTYKVLRVDSLNNQKGGVLYLDETGHKKFSPHKFIYSNNKITENNHWNLNSLTKEDSRIFILLKNGMKLFLKNELKHYLKNTSLTIIDENYNLNRMEVLVLNEYNEKKVLNLKYLMKNYYLEDKYNFKNIYFLNQKSIEKFIINDPVFKENWKNKLIFINSLKK